jgi:hypothetical protein
MQFGANALGDERAPPIRGEDDMVRQLGVRVRRAGSSSSSARVIRPRSGAGAAPNQRVPRAHALGYECIAPFGG